MNNRKLCIILSYLCFFIGMATWIPNFLFQYGYGYWLLTFIINPIGIIFGYVGNSKVTMIINIIMTFSFFILMFIGSLLEAFIA
ncbi:hypothetical protein [Sutcliffiella sp. NC1]|uniref:hypothetical protein n=1 Tax=Sutcliffiella sp. NC1 TaxID=3004096 RepID=UPI0022DDD76F|nr:hypothetical protein [Sutcliffiella sp. NC1]WBL17544.1 hypothetical protein O1A01_10100 [Sutcliffiella sp. NC1]